MGGDRNRPRVARRALCVLAASPVRCGVRLIPQDLARVHDALGVDDALERAHEIERGRVLVSFELAHLGLADAVLGADAAAMLRDEVVHGAADLGRARRERAAVAAGRLAQVVVQVAVGEMAVGYQARTRREALEQRAASLDETRQACRLDRDVVLEARALAALGLWNR